MDDDKLISFEERRKGKRGNRQRAEAFPNVSRENLEERRDVFARPSLRYTFDRYEGFLGSLFGWNHAQRQENPNAGYIVAYTEEHVLRHVALVLKALASQGREYILLQAKGRTFRALGESLKGCPVRTNIEAYEAFEELLLNSNRVLVLQEISKARLPRPASLIAVGLIKILDDAHFDGIYPESDLIFVDYASFLQGAAISCQRCSE